MNKIISFIYCDRLLGEHASFESKEHPLPASGSGRGLFFPHELYKMMLLSNERDVPSCTMACARGLANLDLSFEDAVSYLEILPESLLHLENTLPFVSKLQQVLESRFPTFDGLLVFSEAASEDEEWLDPYLPHDFLRLTPNALELLLRSGRVTVKSENTVFRILECWLKGQIVQGNLKDSMLDRLLPHVKFVAMGGDFLGYYVVAPFSCLMNNPSHFVRLHRALSIHASTNKSTLLSRVERRPGSRWGNPKDGERLVFEVKLDDANRGLPCSKQYLIDGFDLCLSLTSHDFDGVAYPGVGLRLRAYEGREYGEDCQVVKFSNFQWKTKWFIREGEGEHDLSRSTEDVVLGAHDDALIAFGRIAKVKWDEFIKNNGPFFENGLFRFELLLQLTQSVQP